MLVRLPIVLRRVPVSGLSLRSRYCRVDRLPTVLGMEPLMEFWSSCSVVRFENTPMEAGNFPTRLVRVRTILLTCDALLTVVHSIPCHSSVHGLASGDEKFQGYPTDASGETIHAQSSPLVLLYSSKRALYSTGGMFGIARLEREKMNFRAE